MHDAAHRRMHVVADRIAAFLRSRVEFGDVGNELPRDRVGAVGRIDQRGHRLRQRHGVARRDLLKVVGVLAGDEPCARSWRTVRSV